MGTAPAPDLANDFAFKHEFKFIKMINEYVHAINSGNEPLYPYAFIKQYGTSTKRFVDIITVSLGSQTEGPAFEHIIKQQENVYGGMYPSFIEDADGEEIENPISIVKEQSGETVHFLDMEIVQSLSLIHISEPTRPY